MKPSRFHLGAYLSVAPLVLLSLSFPCSSRAQIPAWTGIIDPTRAINWSNAGFSIPSYTVPCVTQPTLLTGSGNDAANTTAIQNALNSCDATHNVVNIPAGTYYVAGVTFGTKGFQVLRGSGANQTSLIFTAEAGCGGLSHGVCMIAPNWTYSGAGNVQPGGSNACTWSSGYAQGTAILTLTNCGSAPPLNQTMILDQANDTSDTSGVYICDGGSSNCTYEGAANANGRVISGHTYSETQTVLVTGVIALGGGSYTVTISPGVYSTNIRSSQTPGAWWPGFVQNDGVENMTLDGTPLTDDGGGILGFFSCYQCWATGVEFKDAWRQAVWIYQSKNIVVRSNYFYGAQSHASVSYNIEPDLSSDFLVENNIMQQTTTPINLNGSDSGAVVDYNFGVDQIYSDGTWSWPIFMGHGPASNFNLFEGNIVNGVQLDNASGPSDQTTNFRNLYPGKQAGTANLTVPIVYRALARNNNFVGNVLGTAGFHTTYQVYATSTTAFSGASNEFVSIYDLGGGGTGDVCSLNPGQSTLCDPLTYSTLMRWGNYDTVNAATQWNSTEASPISNTYINANFTSSYFSSLGHTLPSSLIYSSAPPWWPSGKAFPSIGPDVTTGNVGTCSGGTYAGWLATSSGQCTGGTLSAGWASHALSNPAMDCYLTTMAGPLNGSGPGLSFNAATCYGGATAPPPGKGPGAPTIISAVPITAS